MPFERRPTAIISFMQHENRINVTANYSVRMQAVLIRGDTVRVIFIVDASDLHESGFDYDFAGKIFRTNQTWLWKLAQGYGRRQTKQVENRKKARANLIYQILSLLG